ncbi:hypothetical protein OIU77_009080, partial [Salix suchowensis]
MSSGVILGLQYALIIEFVLHHRFVRMMNFHVPCVF